MSRRDHAIPGDPFRTWVREVDQNNRVRLPLEIRTVVRWMSKRRRGQLECVGKLGPVGGVQLTPLAMHQEEVRRLTEAMTDTPRSSDATERWMDVARFLATAWPMPINIESNRISITLPEPPRRAQQLPQSGGTVVVYAFGEICEIWDALKWHERVRATARRKDAAISEAREDLWQR
jgi:DNA-binding transcriptional regulator/RsmH inhibitor MraZ